MTMTNKKRRVSQEAALRSVFQINPVAAACSALILASGASLAQTQPAAEPKKDEQVQTVTVTGIRKGIESAISVKKNSDNIVESISAEDIGKLPDASIAESIARLPGLTAQRDPKGGAAKTISIRGMSPDFATALLNGREVVSTGDSRNVEFDQYPSEMLAGVNVYKTPDGGLVGQGFAGTVDMRTVRPLDFGQRQIVLNYRQEQNGVGALAEGDGTRYSFSYIDQFLDRTLGLAIGYAKTDRDLGSQTRGGCWGLADYTYQGNAIRTCGGFEFFTDSITEQREGVMAVLEFKPSKNFSSTLDLMYSTYDKQIDKKGFQGALIWGGGDSLPYGQPRVLRDATIVDGVAVSGTWDNFRGIIRNDAQSIQDELSAVGWNNKLKLADGWSAGLDLSYSHADRKEAIVETTASTATFQADTLAFNTDGGTFGVTPGLSYADPNQMVLTDVMGWGGGAGAPQAGYTKLPHVTDELASVRLSGRKDLEGNSWFSGVDFGFNYADRKKNREFIEGQLRIKGGDPYGTAAMPGGSTVLAGDSGIPIAVFDPVANLNSVYDIASKLHPDIYNKDWDVKEKLSTVYAKADIDTELFGVPVRGNLGLQVVQADQQSTAWVVNRAVPGQDDSNRTATLTTNGATYADVLPSLNLAFDLGSQNIVRFGLAKVMARPNMADMRTSFAFDVNVQTGEYSGSGGNPWLRPFRANAFDLAYEKYWGNKAYVGVAAFYKDVKTYVINDGVSFDFTPYIDANTTPAPGGNIGTLTVPVNGKGGSISGIELAGSLPLDMLWKPLAGFGLVASYSNTSSSLNPPDTTDGGSGRMELPGLSKEVSSLTAYYENGGFQVRVSQRQRSDFVGERRTDIGDRQLVYIKGETISDAQIGYEFQSGWLKGLGVLLQGYNLGNTKYKRYADTPNNVVETVNVGTTYLLGVNYKL